ncbi:MAG: helix-turn-helix domain-containing protein, partial [Cypionkella sp.]
SETLADLSGRLPRQLLPLLATWPLLTAPMAEALTSASRAAVQRNLDLMQNRGLIREITGQSRYRVWMAAF